MGDGWKGEKHLVVVVLVLVMMMGMPALFPSASIDG